MAWGTVELEPAVRDWLEQLPTAQFAHAAFYVDLLAEQGLRFYLGRDAVRVTYWIASGRRIILLTAFRKTRMRENREVERAHRALVRCQVEAHTVDEEG